VQNLVLLAHKWHPTPTRRVSMPLCWRHLCVCHSNHTGLRIMKASLRFHGSEVGVWALEHEDNENKTQDLYFCRGHYQWGSSYTEWMQRDSKIT
jgi:hypothetical protein